MELSANESLIYTSKTNYGLLAQIGEIIKEGGLM